MTEIKIYEPKELYWVDPFFQRIYDSLESSLMDLSLQINAIEPDFNLWGYKNQLVSSILDEKGLYYLLCLRHKMNEMINDLQTPKALGGVK